MLSAFRSAVVTGRANPQQEHPMTATERILVSPNLLPTVVCTIRENHDAALEEALPILDQFQQRAPGEPADKQRSEAAAMLRENSGGRGGAADARVD